MLTTKIGAPGTWRQPARHTVSLLTHPYYRALAQVQDCLHHAANTYFRNRQFGTIDLPLTTGSISSPMGSGSDSLPVEIDFLGERTYLADSMQFMLELGCRLHTTGAYYKALSFRGEVSDDTHLNQFHHVECECPGTLDDVMSLAAGLVHDLTETLLRQCAEQVSALAGSVDHLERLIACGGCWPQISCGDAVAALTRQGEGLVRRHAAGFDIITKQGEAALVQTAGNGLAVWLTGFPTLSVPFYQARELRDPSTTLTADLLIGSCEVVGSGQRHVAAADVERALAEQDVPRAPYAWYLEMRDVHPLQTAGFGLGLERYLMWALQQSDIRDCTLLPGALGAGATP